MRQGLRMGQTENGLAEALGDSKREAVQIAP